MAALTNELLSYGDVSRVVSVLPLVEILTAEENWFLRNLGRVKSTDATQITLTDTLAAAGTQAVAEEVDYNALVRTTPVRLTNLIEKIAVPYKVSKTQQLIQHYHGENELVRQRSKALREWGNAAEFDLVRSTIASGVSGTTPKMDGIAAAISKSTNTSAHSSGTTLTSTILQNLMRDNWLNSKGDVATDVFTGSFLRNVIDLFANKSNTIVSVDARVVDIAVDVYNTSAGRINIHLHRYVQISTDATGRLLGVRPEKLKVAFLREPIMEKLASTGDYDFEAIVGDLTLSVINQDSNFFYTGFDID